MTKITDSMLSNITDNDDILEYINSLEEDIEKTTEVEKKLDIIIDNILDKFDNFKDIRSVRASNISAINELIRTKKDIQDSKISGKKSLLDMVMKKRIADAKNITSAEINDNKQYFDFKSLLIHLDSLNIHPIIDSNVLNKAEELIDTQDDYLSLTESIKEE